MTFPYLILAFGFFAVMAYFARKQVTYTSQRGTSGSIGGAFVALIVAAIAGWLMDAYLNWSIVPQYMYQAGGTLNAIAIAFFASFALLCLSMLVAAKKTGVMVA